MQLPTTNYELRYEKREDIQGNSSVSFTSRVKLLAEQLSNAEVKFNKHKEIKIRETDPEENAEFMDVNRVQQIPRTGEKRKREMQRFRGRDSIFKCPSAPAPRSSYRTIPDYHKNPHKWIKYTLDDVSNDNMTKQSNAQAAFSFLKELKARKQMKILAQMDIDESYSSLNNTKAILKSRDVDPSLQLQFKKPYSDINVLSNLPIVIDTNDKAIFKNSKVVMPEHVVGQKQQKKFKKIIRTDKINNPIQIKLKHLHELDDEED